MAFPALFALLTVQRSVDYELTLRHYSLPVVCAEALIVLLALRSGFSFTSAWRTLGRSTRIATVVWASSVLVAALFATRDPYAAWVWVAIHLIHGALALALFDSFATRWAHAVTDLLRAAAFGLAGYAVVSVILTFVLSPVPEFPWIYFGIGVANVRQIAFYGIPLVAIALGLAANPAAIADRRATLPLLCVGFFLICWSGGRANFLAAAMSVAAALALTAPGRRKALGFQVLAALVLAIPVSILLAPHPLFGAANFGRFLNNGGSDLNAYSSSRLDIWLMTLKAIVSQPFVGHGQGQFPYLIYKTFDVYYNHPHNFALQFAYEWGVAGAVAITFLAGKTMSRLGALIEHDRYLAVTASAGLVGLTFNAALEGAFFHPLPVTFTLFFLSIVGASARARTSRQAAPLLGATG